MLYTKYMFGIYEIRADSHCYQADKFLLSQAAFLTGINGVHMQQMQLQCRKANDIVITPCYCKE